MREKPGPAQPEEGAEDDILTPEEREALAEKDTLHVTGARRIASQPVHHLFVAVCHTWSRSCVVQQGATPENHE